MKNKFLKLSLKQLATLLIASNDNVDISDLCDYRFSLRQLDLLISARRNGVNVSPIANPLIPSENMEILIEAIISGLFIEEFANPLLDKDKLLFLVAAQHAGINVKGLSNPYIEIDSLKELLVLREKGYDNENTDISNMTPAQVEEFTFLKGKLDAVGILMELCRKKAFEHLLNLINNGSDNNKDMVQGHQDRVPARVKIYRVYKNNVNQ